MKAIGSLLRITQRRDDARDSDGPVGEPVILGGRETLEVVGESHYQEGLLALVGDATGHVRVAIVAALYPEMDNRYDPNAISVWIRRCEVGYLSRADAGRYRPGLLALQQGRGRPIALHGDVVGEDTYGVFLRHDPREFGLDVGPAPRPHEGNMRTGLSEALLTDADDNAYDLGWLNGLPFDTTARIARLNELLLAERDPIDRHFMFHELEGALYRVRNAIPTALADFDKACQQHDAEIDVLRRAFMRKWGRVPWLQTYHQMAIREQKARNYERALWWTQRGVSVYGNDAARPEAVSDLSERAASFAKKLAAPAEVPRHARKAAPAPSTEEALRCARCGNAFVRMRTRGPKPHLCPACRELD